MSQQWVAGHTLLYTGGTGLRERDDCSSSDEPHAAQPPTRRSSVGSVGPGKFPESSAEGYEVYYSYRVFDPYGSESLDGGRSPKCNFRLLNTKFGGCGASGRI